MLCQLVCVDRRYQRMNCFNIRELQGILKRKFFTDLVNTSDSHKAMDSTLISMRHKNNMSNILLYDQSLFYNFDLTNTSKYKSYNFNPGKVYTYAGLGVGSNTNNTIKTDYLKHLNINLFNYSLSTIFTVIKDILNFIYIPSLTTLSTIIQSIHFFKTSLINTLYINTYIDFKYFSFNLISGNSVELSDSYKSSTTNYTSFNKLNSSNFSENSSSWRFNRYSYPLISYDYKSGNYLSIWDQLYPSLSLAFIEVARGIRKAPWFFSDQFWFT
jgi:hypothetical protein